MVIGESKRLILRTLEDQDIDSVMLFWGNPDEAELIYHFSKTAGV